MKHLANTRIGLLMGLLMGLLLLWTGTAVAQTGEVSGTASVSVGGAAAGEATGEATADDNAALALKAEIAKAEAEKAKAEAEKAKADAARARAEADAKKAEADVASQVEASVAVTAPVPSPAPPAPQPEVQYSNQEEQPNHRGFYLRFTPGLGLGTAWAKGMMDPRPGIEAIDDPMHSSLTGTIGFDIGAGLVKNLALHVGTFYEKMIFREKDPTRISFSILGVDAGLTWYFTDLELYITGKFRWVGMLLKFPEVSCSEYFEDTFEWYKGPGLSFTIGREWFDGPRDQSATGIGIQTNYYRMHGGIDNAYAFNHFSLLLVLTFTHF